MPSLSSIIKISPTYVLDKDFSIYLTKTTSESAEYQFNMRHVSWSCVILNMIRLCPLCNIQYSYLEPQKRSTNIQNAQFNGLRLSDIREQLVGNDLKSGGAVAKHAKDISFQPILA